MDVTACSPGAWYPFSDPKVEEEKLMAIFVTLIETEIERETTDMPTEWERKTSNLMRILRYFNHSPERALVHWKEWVKWRHDVKVDEITDQDIAFELTSGLAFWKGKDKCGRPCLVLTGRMMDPETSQGNLTSMKKFMIRRIEEGCKLADEAGVETFCLIYDRRGLGFNNIDPIMQQLTRTTMDNLRTFYSERMGQLYIIHANWLYWGAFAILLKPFLSIFTSNIKKILLLHNEKALLPYFDEEQIPLLPIEATAAAYLELRIQAGEAARTAIAEEQASKIVAVEPVSNILR